MSRSRPTASDFLQSAYDPELEKNFFSRILLPGGMWKTTDCHRLDDVNEALIPLLRNFKESPLKAMDIGASSGVATQEWSDYLSSRGFAVRVVGSDLAVYARHLKWHFIEALLDDENRIMHLGILNRGIPPIGKLHQIPLIFPLKVMAHLLLYAGAKTTTVPLVSKAVRNIELIQEDIAADAKHFHGQFHVIRAANLLSAQYFSSLQLTNMVRIITRRLLPLGFLIITRTLSDRTNHGTIFKCTPGQVVVAGRVGNGSELEELLARSVPQKV